MPADVDGLQRCPVIVGNAVCGYVSRWHELCSDPEALAGRESRHAEHLHLEAVHRREHPLRERPPNRFAEVSAADRARRYLSRMPPAISGAGGHLAAMRAAVVLVQKFELPETEALPLLEEWNQGCQPKWSRRELEHKLKSAVKGGGRRG